MIGRSSRAAINASVVVVMVLGLGCVPGQPAVRAYSGPVELDCGVVCSVPPGRVFSEVADPLPS
jgi:hypothetical protein